jgi:hypothetical protein
MEGLKTMDSFGNRYELKILLNESRGLCLAQGWERRPRVDCKREVN